MTPERWKQLDVLFHEALELQGEARVAFLSKVCGDDEQLRLETERLIAAHERESDFIDSRIFVDTLGLNDDDPDESLVGRCVGPYQIINQLGRGGMGEVYLAEDTRLERKVALKVLPAAFTRNPERVRRFEREAKAASATNHPNILTIYEIGQMEGLHFIATEFVDGMTLRERMDGSMISLAETLEIGVQVSNALAAAHEAGIVHRDIKPENVMVRPDGLIKVLDFGLAKLTEQPAAWSGSKIEIHAPTVARLITEPGLVLGTAQYMSPEQARGLKVDYRTDIFSLGAMMYEMVAGRQPFEGRTPTDVIAAILTSEPSPLTRFRPGLSPELEQIIGRMLEKEREARYQSAVELRAELQRLQRNEVSAAYKSVGTEEEPAFIAVDKAAEEAKSEAASGTDREQIDRRSFRLRNRNVTVISIVALTLAAIIYMKLFRESPALQPPEIKSLVVLPLENLSGDPAQQYFADGMTDALIGDLAKIASLRVISRTSAMHYKDTKKSLPQIASELGVDAVVEGSVQRFGDRVSIRAQLIHATTERHLWGDRYERDLGDVLRLQSEVAQAIASEIRTKITPAERTRLAVKTSVKREAFDDYLKGQYHRNKQTEEHLLKAIEYFQSAISADPSYAPAYAGLAECYGMLGSVMIGALSPLEARRRAEEAAEKALEFDHGLVEAHLALGYVKMYNWDWAAAEQEFKRAIELNPNSALAHTYYSRYLTSICRADEAIAEMDRAQELDPLSLAISVQRGFVLEMTRRYDEIVDGLGRVIAQDPNNYQARWILGRAYVAKGQLEEAIMTFEKAAVLSRRAPGALGTLGMAYGLAGRKEEANRVLRELLDLNRRGYVPPVAVAQVYTGLGKKDQAFDWLEKAYQERSYFMAYLKVSPTADPLRSDPRFDDLLRRVGLAP